MTVEINWPQKAEALWSLLDDISTASDMIKPHDERSYKAFYDFAMKKCEQRSQHMVSPDGYSLLALEDLQDQKDIEKHVNLLQSFHSLYKDSTEKLIAAKMSEMTQEEKQNYTFQWSQLVSQEIDMWISINKPVSNEEFDHICDVRCFDDIMINYLRSALEYIGLMSTTATES